MAKHLRKALAKYNANRNATLVLREWTKKHHGVAAVRVNADTALKLPGSMKR